LKIASFFDIADLLITKFAQPFSVFPKVSSTTSLIGYNACSLSWNWSKLKETVGKVEKKY
jgi:hypothetical protein